MTCGLVLKLDDNQISCAVFVDYLDYGTLMDALLKMTAQILINSVLV